MFAGKFIPLNSVGVTASRVRRGIAGVTLDRHDSLSLYGPVTVMKQFIVGHESPLLQSGMMAFLRDQQSTKSRTVWLQWGGIYSPLD